MLQALAFGFANGLPLPLTLVGTPYAFKFLWSPLIDRLPPPPGWGGDLAGE